MYPVLLLIFSASFTQPSNLRTADRRQINCPLKPELKPHLIFEFGGEQFDSFHYASELTAAYECLYYLFESNPNNFKALDKGVLVIKLRHSGLVFEFDSLAEGNTAKNNKVFAFIGKKFSSARVTDRETLELRIFIRKSNSVSASLDTMDMLDVRNRFKNKSAETIVVGGKNLGKTKALRAHALLFRHPAAAIDKNGDELYFNLVNDASFPGGNEGFIDYINDNFYHPAECDQIWQEATFDFNIRFQVRVNERGQMDSLNFLSFNPRYDYKSRYYDLICKELKRCIIRRQIYWKPKQVGMTSIYTYYAITLKGRRID